MDITTSGKFHFHFIFSFFPLPLLPKTHILILSRIKLEWDYCICVSSLLGVVNGSPSKAVTRIT